MKSRPIDLNAYQVIDSNGNRRKVCKNRIQRATPDLKEIMWKKGYEITLYNTDIRDLLHTYEVCDTTDEGVADYISNKLFNSKPLQVITNQFISYPVSAQIYLKIVLDEEAIEITNPTQTEINNWEKQEAKLVNNKLFTTFFSKNVQAVMNAYNLKLYTYSRTHEICLAFENETALADFIKQAVTELVVPKLTKLGLHGTVKNKTIKKCLKRSGPTNPIIEDLIVDKTILQ